MYFFLGLISKIEFVVYVSLFIVGLMIIGVCILKYVIKILDLYLFLILISVMYLN